MAENKDKTKSEQEKTKERQRDISEQQQKPQERTIQEDKQDLRDQVDATRDRGGRAADVEKDPAEAQENDADWYNGRKPNDVVEVDGQRETVEARMARNGVNSPEARAGATHL